MQKEMIITEGKLVLLHEKDFVIVALDPFL
jgi:hypothetical protein